MPSRIIAGIDIGSTKIVTVIAEIDPDDAVRILGYGIVPSKGVDRGKITNLEEVTRAVGNSISMAEQMGGYRIGSAYVSISSQHIQAYSQMGSAAITRDMTVTRDHIMRAIENAQAIKLPPGTEILHVMPYCYVLDDVMYADPCGINGYRLDVHVHMVVCETLAIQNLITVMKNNGVEIDDVVLQPLAAAEAVLTDTDRENGVVLIDIGSSATGVAFIAQGNTTHTHIIPIGSNTVTNDICLTFNISPHSAEHNKKQIGEAIADEVRHKDIIEIEGRMAGVRVPIQRFQFNDCIQARLDELIDFIISEVDYSNYNGAYAAGVVLTGGGALLNRVEDLFVMRFNAPVRIGDVGQLRGHSDVLQSPMFATVIGLVRWGFNHGVGHGPQNAEPSTWLELYERVKMWLREFLP